MLRSQVITPSGVEPRQELDPSRSVCIAPDRNAKRLEPAV